MSKGFATSVKRFWKIERYESAKSVYKKILPFGYLSEKEMTSLLQRLASQHLENYEIVSASLRLNTKGHTSHLEPLIDRQRLSGSRFTISVGSNPYYTASVWERDELDNLNEGC